MFINCLIASYISRSACWFASSRRARLLHLFSFSAAYSPDLWTRQCLSYLELLSSEWVVFRNSNTSYVSNFIQTVHSIPPGMAMEVVISKHGGIKGPRKWFIQHAFAPVQCRSLQMDSQLGQWGYPWKASAGSFSGTVVRFPELEELFFFEELHVAHHFSW